MILTDTALEQLAKAATPGPWETDYDIERSPNLWIVAPSAQEAALCKFETWDLGENKHGQLSQKDFADAAFIAAFNPAVALDLLTRLRAAERERDEIKKLLSDAAQVLYKNTSPETQLVERLGDCITQLRARAEAAEKERDEARSAADLWLKSPAPLSADVVEKVARAIAGDEKGRVGFVWQNFIGEANAAIAALTALGWKEPQ